MKKPCASQPHRSSGIGIIGAMPEEIAGVITLLRNRETTLLAKREYHTGFIGDTPVVVCMSRWGKVAAAATTATLIQHFSVNAILFTGVAGAMKPDLRIGDIVIGTELMQHDMDARPFIRQFEIPLLNCLSFQADNNLSQKAHTACVQVLENKTLHELFTQETLDRYGISTPQVYQGLIASGDRFIAREDERKELIRLIPEILAVDMESAAVAQVCFENEIPFSIIRVISDGANDASPVDFAGFVRDIETQYSRAIIKALFMHDAATER